MTSAVDIQIVSAPNLDKIENFFKDVSYRETIEFSANFNTRLCLERRLRLPFFDPQTRVAQNHSHLFMDKRQRMPGFRQGQIYTYPSTRWRKSRRQYLNKMYRFPDRPFQSLRKEQESSVVTGNAGTASPLIGSSIGSMFDSDLNGTLLDESLSLGAAGGDTSDSKDSQQLIVQQQQQPPLPVKDDMSKEWFYDDIEMNELDALEDPKSPGDDELDYDPRYGTKKRRKRRPNKRDATTPSEGGGGGGGRRRTGGQRGRKSASSSTAATSDISHSTVDTNDGNSRGLTSELTATPTSGTTSTGRRPRGTGGTRGRRRTKGKNANVCDPPSPGLNSEPPSFESAAAAVGVLGDLTGVGLSDEQVDLRNYRKFL
ncbi:zinc finger protein DPF3 [Rhagoletis pomonella]|uniref:zinc finger protein DPF3 n=1 Tax=Rhagoletis pomonella TaxID=28610 RepID=UPI001782C280|nr:zinc finger protein DPF3 [Rhagoletis pomonella]